MRPAFNGGVIGFHEFSVCALQTLEQRSVFNRNRSLTCKRFKETEPFVFRIEHGTLKDLHNTFDVTLANEGRRIIADKTFFRQRRRLDQTLRVAPQVRDMNGSSFKGGTPSHSFPKL